MSLDYVQRFVPLTTAFVGIKRDRRQNAVRRKRRRNALVEMVDKRR